MPLPRATMLPALQWEHIVGPYAETGDFLGKDPGLRWPKAICWHALRGALRLCHELQLHMPSPRTRAGSHGPMAQQSHLVAPPAKPQRTLFAGENRLFTRPDMFWAPPPPPRPPRFFGPRNFFPKTPKKYAWAGPNDFMVIDL